ncbi:MAG: hypothetical protein H6R13_3655 [Proteobacteria bacterium]|nr:hypothetical protein [Pseudomonadota bacterium]
MNKLETELQRLYFLPGQEWPGLKSNAGNAAVDLVTAGGLVRSLVISVERGGDWEAVAALYEGVQADLDLPPPAISVSGDEGYQIWFSLSEPIPVQLAQDFMQGLSRRYLAEIKLAKLKLRPGSPDELHTVPLVPAELENGDRWSAFIDPTMGSMFVEETWLEMPPSLDKQAGMLASLESIKAQDFQQALSILESPTETSVEASAQLPRAQSNDSALPRLSDKESALSVGTRFTNPKDFLLAVMNDPNATTDQRIAAASALLPFVASDPEK